MVLCARAEISKSRSRQMNDGRGGGSLRCGAARATRTVAIAMLGATVAACVTGPNNGDAVSGPVIGRQFTYEGSTNASNELITLEVMASPDLDPAQNASWVPFATTYTDITPSYVN